MEIRRNKQSEERLSAEFMASKAPRAATLVVRAGARESIVGNAVSDQSPYIVTKY